MIELPPMETLEVSRHVAFPSDSSILVKEHLTGVPIDMTGATVTTKVALAAGEAALISCTHDVINGPGGEIEDISFSEANHESLPPVNELDANTLLGAVRFYWDTKVTGAAGMPDTILRRGYYIVHDGANT